MANTRIKRDLDDRLIDRAQEVKDRANAADPNDIARRERIDAFRDKWAIVHCLTFLRTQFLECTCAGCQQPTHMTVSTNVWH